MKDLIEKLEAATEPSRELDALIFCAVNPGWVPAPPERGEAGSVQKAEHVGPAEYFTSSFDAAIELMPELVSVSIWTGTQRAPTPSWTWPVVEARSNSTDALIWKGQAKTLALAICIAALKARHNSLRPDQKEEGK